MKRVQALVLLFLGVLVCLLLLNCDDNPVNHGDPHAPTARITEAPANGSINQSPFIEFHWTGSDPDGDPVTYTFFLDTIRDAEPVQIDFVDTSYFAYNLTLGETYFYFVEIRDTSGRATTTFPRSFTVAGEANYSWMYPLSVGNQWVYDGMLYYENVRIDDSATAEQYNDTLHWSDEITDVALDTLFGGIAGHRLRAISSDPSIPGDSGYAWVSNHGDGFYTLFREGRLSSLAFPKLKAFGKLSFRGVGYDNLEDLLNRLMVEPTPLGALASGDVLLVPPYKTLQYPLEVGTEWMVYTANWYFPISKIVEDHENITVPAGTFRSYRIRYRFDLDRDGVWDDSVSVIDYFADEGLVSRSISVLGLVLMDWGGDILGTYDIVEDIVLTDYTLQ